MYLAENQKFLKSSGGNYPRELKSKEEHLLFNWVTTQRNNFKKGTIDPDRKTLLDSIDFKMDISSYRDEKWKEKFNRFQKFLKSNGGAISQINKKKRH